jgi:hypothetical protein
MRSQNRQEILFFGPSALPDLLLKITFVKIDTPILLIINKKLFLVRNAIIIHPSEQDLSIVIKQQPIPIPIAVGIIAHVLYHRMVLAVPKIFFPKPAGLTPEKMTFELFFSSFFVKFLTETMLFISIVNFPNINVLTQRP